MEKIAYHIPALLLPTIDGVVTRRDGTYIDATFGGGGHSKELLCRLGSGGRLFSFDQDIDAYDNRIDDKRFCFVLSNFRYLKNFMRYYGVEQIDGLVADLGVSFHHFDMAERGFSFRYEAPLDMRMNSSSLLTAAQVVNTYDTNSLIRIFKLWGEISNAHRMADAIVKRRAQKEIYTTTELAELLTPFCGHDKEKKELAKVFQALRIEVNDEMGALKEMLTAAQELLSDGGRIAILTYHSLEDRIVKNFFRSGNIDGEIEKDFYGRKKCPLRVVNTKVITADEQEVAENPRARSAKLRIAEKIANE
ncbi:MAG: 16S rRNA (cytosine(1402)-N(4))-methyltransferase RsmH [Paludibacteraceae bacterium]|nr:16S rRNA (cytosine(1402)-N(4))-methyltransferase RsmH [Paludibacteraceae bacterium]